MMPLEVTPSPGAPPSSALNSVNSHMCTSPAVSAQLKVFDRPFQFVSQQCCSALCVLYGGPGHVVSGHSDDIRGSSLQKKHNFVK